MNETARDEFDREFMVRGGRLDRSQCSDRIRKMIDDALSASSAAITGFKQRFHGHGLGEGPHVDFVANDELAASYSASGFVAIHIGVIQRLYGTFYSLLAEPTILTFVGDPKLEVAAPESFEFMHATIPLEEHGPCDNVRIPQCPNRGTYAMLLASCAIDHVVLHEIGHATGGHFDFLASQADRLPFGHLVKPSMQIAEHDADMFAACTGFLSSLDDRLNDSLPDMFENRESKHGQALLAWAVSLGVLMQLLAEDACTIQESTHDTHPHPHVRLICILANCLNRVHETPQFAVAESQLARALELVAEISTACRMHAAVTPVTDIEHQLREACKNLACSAFGKRAELIMHRKTGVDHTL
jgi:hypothetical protein